MTKETKDVVRNVINIICTILSAIAAAITQTSCINHLMN